MYTKSIIIYKRLLKYTAPYKFRLIIGILAGFISGGSLFGVLHFTPDLVRPFEGREVVPEKKEETDGTLGIIQRIADKFGIPTTMPSGKMSWQFMLLSILGLPICFLFKAAAGYINSYLMRWVGSRIILDIRNELFANLQRQSLKFFGTMDVGKTISRCTTDTAAVERSISNSIAEITTAPIEILAAIVFIFIFSIKHDVYILTISMFILFPLYVIPITIVGRKLRAYTYKSLEEVSHLVTRLHENLTGMRVVKAFHTEEQEKVRFHESGLKYFRQVMGASKANLVMKPLMEFVSIACVCGFILYCYILSIPLSQILPLVGAIMLAYAPTKRLTKSYSDILQSSAAAERIFELLDLDTSLPEAKNPIKLRQFKDRIVFDNVAFSYDNKSPFSLKEISFEIPKGKLVAFVGETGSGKSTLANILARFYDPDAGEVRIDNVILPNIETASLRKLIGIVMQETLLFNDTLFNNIAYGMKEASQDEVINAAKRANAHEFIMEAPQGYQRLAGDKGFQLSGGQRQRIAIARALLRNPEILILDEATSALDIATEQLIKEALDRLMANRTVFAIAHRLSTVRDAYKIFVMDNGRIIEQGDHEDLIAQNGYYAKLYQKQFE